MKLSYIAVRNISRNKRRSLLTMIAIALAAMVIVFMFSIIEGMKADQLNTIIRFTTGQICIRNPEYTKNEILRPLDLNIGNYEQIIRVLRGLPGLEQFSPRIDFIADFGLRATMDGGVRIIQDTLRAHGIAVDFAHEKNFGNLSKYLEAGDFPAGNQILASTGLAEALEAGKNTKLTAFVTTLGGNSMQAFSATISGLIRFPAATLNQRTFLMPLESAQQLLGMDDAIVELLLLFRDDRNLEEKVQLVKSSLAGAGFSGLEVTPWKQIGVTYSWLQLAEVSYNFIAFFFFFIATTVIINTIMMVIYERMREIGTISALGMTGAQIVRLFFMEAFFLSVIASFVGVLLGAALVIPLSITGFNFGQLADLGKMDLAVSNVIYPVLNLKSTLLVFVYSVLVASVVSIIPSRKASKIEPVRALKAV